LCGVLCPLEVLPPPTSHLLFVPPTTIEVLCSSVLVICPRLFPLLTECGSFSSSEFPLPKASFVTSVFFSFFHWRGLFFSGRPRRPTAIPLGAAIGIVPPLLHVPLSVNRSPHFILSERFLVGAEDSIFIFPPPFSLQDPSIATPALLRPFSFFICF